MENTFYHKALRTVAVLVAVVLVFDSGILFQGTRKLSVNTQQYIASVVSISASVTPTDLNTITAELTKRQQELDQREAALSEREINARAADTTPNNNYSTYILSAILLLLLMLIVLNYVLDFVRARRRDMTYASTP